MKQVVRTSSHLLFKTKPTQTLKLLSNKCFFIRTCYKQPNNTVFLTPFRITPPVRLYSSQVQQSQETPSLVNHDLDEERDEHEHDEDLEDNIPNENDFEKVNDEKFDRIWSLIDEKQYKRALEEIESLDNETKKLMWCQNARFRAIIGLRSPATTVSKEIIDKYKQELHTEFNEMRKNLATYFMFIKWCYRFSKKSIPYLYDRLLADGITPPVSIFPLIIGSAYTKSLLEKYWNDFRKFSKGAKPPLRMYTRTISMCLETEMNDVHLAVEYMNKAHQDGYLFSPTIYDLIFNACLMSSATLPVAWDILEKYKRRMSSELAPKAETIVEGTYLLFLNAAGGKGNYTLAESAWITMCNHGIVPRGVHFHAIFSAYAVGQQYEAAFRTINQMKEQGIKLHYSSLHILSRMICYNVDEIDKAYYCLTDMYNNGEPVDIACLNLIIRACAFAKDLHRAFGTFAEISSFGLDPDLHTYNNMILACVHTEQSNNAAGLYSDMKQQGIKPNITTFELLIQVMLCSVHNLRRVFSILEDVVANGYTPTKKMIVPILQQVHNIKHIAFIEKAIEWAKKYNIEAPPELLQIPERARVRPFGRILQNPTNIERESSTPK